MLSSHEMKPLMKQQEQPCVSIFMPTHRAGIEVQQDPIRLKNLLGHAEERLIESGFRNPKATELLKPAQELLQRAAFWRRQRDGLAIFVSSKMFQAYRLPLHFQELVVVSGRFHIKPLLPLVGSDARFYILALSQNEVRLLEGTCCSVEEVDLENVPESINEALRWDDPEKRLQWHTRTGTQANGKRAAMFHGHGVANATDSKGYIRRYFRQIDEGLGELLRGERAPLVLTGVDYILPIYREANSYHHLLDEAIAGNPEELSAEQLHKKAWAVVQPHFDREREEAAAQYQQLAGAGSRQASKEVEEIVQAAYHGRVEILFVGLGLQQWGSFDGDTNTAELHQEAEPGDEDLLDFAAAQTLLNGGSAYAVEPEDVPGGAPLAAVFRY